MVVFLLKEGNDFICQVMYIDDDLIKETCPAATVTEVEADDELQFAGDDLGISDLL